MGLKLIRKAAFFWLAVLLYSLVLFFIVPWLCLTMVLGSLSKGILALRKGEYVSSVS